MLKVRMGQSLNAVKQIFYDVWEQVRQKNGLTVGIDIDPYDLN